MNFKVGETKPKSIVKGLLVLGIVYCVLMFLEQLFRYLIINSNISFIHYIDHYIYLFKSFGLPILLICLIKLLCEVIYIILKAAEIIINDK